MVYYAMAWQSERDTGGNIKTLTRRDKEHSDIEIKTRGEMRKLKTQEFI